MPSHVNMYQRNKTPIPELRAQIKELMSKDCDCCGFRPTQEQVARKFGISRSVVAKITANYYD
jgi:hypothetical protein